MKIMIMPTSYPDESNPVRNIFIQEQTKALADLGHQVTVLHVQKQPSKALFKRLDTKIKRSDEGFAVRYSQKIKTFMEGRFPGLNRDHFVRCMKRLFAEALAKEGRPDVIYSHFACWAGYTAVQIGQQYNIPVVSIEHYSGYMTPNVNKGMIEGLRYTVERSAACMAVSGNLKDAMYRLTGTDKPITVVSNMIDDRFAYTAPREHEGFVFSAVANLNKRKRFSLLLEAFFEAFSAEENVSLVIGGSGEEEQNLVQLIRDNKREHQVRMLGRLGRDDTLQVYQESDCFVLPSAAETFGIVWREAMAVGRPVITTDHGGWSAEDWSDEYGVKIDVDDKLALIAALRSVRAEYAKYDLEKISRATRERHGAQVIGKQIEGIMRKALEEKTH